MAVSLRSSLAQERKVLGLFMPAMERQRRRPADCSLEKAKSASPGIKKVFFQILEGLGSLRSQILAGNVQRWPIHEISCIGRSCPIRLEMHNIGPYMKFHV